MSLSYLGQLLILRSNGQGQGHSSPQDQNKQVVGLQLKGILVAKHSSELQAILYVYGVIALSKVSGICWLDVLGVNLPTPSSGFWFTLYILLSWHLWIYLQYTSVA